MQIHGTENEKKKDFFKWSLGPDPSTFLLQTGSGSIILQREPGPFFYRPDPDSLFYGPEQGRFFYGSDPNNFEEPDQGWCFLQTDEMDSKYIRYYTWLYPKIYNYIYFSFLSVCLFVSLFPINVKTAEPIGPKFFVGPRLTPEKVYEWSELKKFSKHCWFL